MYISINYNSINYDYQIKIKGIWRMKKKIKKKLMKLIS